MPTIFVRPARESGMLEQAIRREIRSLDAGSHADRLFYTDAELRDTRRCVVVVASPQDAFHAVVQALAGVWRAEQRVGVAAVRDGTNG